MGSLRDVEAIVECEAIGTHHFSVKDNYVSTERGAGEHLLE